MRWLDRGELLPVLSTFCEVVDRVYRRGFSNRRVIPGRAAGRVQSGRGAVLGVYELRLGLGQEIFDAGGVSRLTAALPTLI